MIQETCFLLKWLAVWVACEGVALKALLALGEYMVGETLVKDGWDIVLRRKTRFERFIELPEDAKNVVISFLDVPSICKLESTCTELKSLVSNSVVACKVWTRTCGIEEAKTRQYLKVSLDISQTRRNAEELLINLAGSELALLARNGELLRVLAQGCSKQAFLPAQLGYFSCKNVALAASSQARHVIFLTSTNVAVSLRKSGISGRNLVFVSFAVAMEYGEGIARSVEYPTSAKGFMGYFVDLMVLEPQFEKFRAALWMVFGQASLWRSQLDIDLAGVSREDAVALDKFKTGEGDLPWKKALPVFTSWEQVCWRKEHLHRLHHNLHNKQV